MVCHHPLKGWRSRSVNPDTGLRQVVFNIGDGLADRPQNVPCGQCAGCRLRRTREWSLRMIHEASLHQSNLFLTLTYNNAALPADRSLSLLHFQQFMYRLRKKKGPNIRFYHCGEYGPETLRPHYHAIMFNLSFSDQILYSANGGKNPIYSSAELDKIWSHGECKIGDVNVTTARYVAGYIQKKVTGERADLHYQRHSLDNQTGEILNTWTVAPEYATMSRRPGIGIGWFTKFKNDCYPSDFITHEGAKHPVPRAYDRELQKEFVKEIVHLRYKRKIWNERNQLTTVKSARKKAANTPLARSEQQPARLAVKARIAKLDQIAHNERNNIK